MLNVMKIVRVRVCAQVDLTFGEDVAALSRLLSYDDRYLMRAALRSGEKEHENTSSEETETNSASEKCRI